MHATLRLAPRSAHCVLRPSLAVASRYNRLSTSARPLPRRVSQNRKPLSAQLQRPHHPPRGQLPHGQPLVASSAGTIAAVLAAVVGIVAYSTYQSKETASQHIEDSPDLPAMATEIAPGRPGNLTPEQEEKLKQLWKLIFQVCGVGQDEGGASISAAAAQKTDDKKELKDRMSFFSRGKGKKESEPDAAPPNAQVVLNLGNNGEADKYGQTKHFYDTLTSQSPESIRDTIWSMVKHDHPDALVLRFLRARKWDVERALIMMISTMNWRAQEMKVDEDIMVNGEAAALLAEQTSDDAMTKKLGHDFMTQIRKGISYVHGVDKAGRPLCFVNVRLHRQGEQEEKALERYTVYLIETCRMLLQTPVDTATVVFDMTNFSLANMDYAPVKFMIKCFEANYPESLGTVLVHKAPWIFQGIWKVIRGLLDPVVANKVHFTNNAKEMEAFIPTKHIPASLEGEEDWTYSYVEPDAAAHENAKLADTATRDRLLAARADLYHAYEAATLEWIRCPAGDVAAAQAVKARRDAVAERLRVDYWVVDPYVRARSYYDRIGVLMEGGGLNWYPEAEAGRKTGEANGTAVAAAAAAPVAASVAAAPAAALPAATQTSADDID